MSTLLNGGLLTLLWIEHRTDIRIPAPTGPFAVGRSMQVWADDTGVDPSAADPVTPRQVIAWIWYPAAKPDGARISAEYMPATWRSAVERQRGTPISRFLTRGLSRIHPHSISNARLSDKYPTYPVVMLRAGFSALTIEYTTLAEDLASHGYVVIGIDAPYRTDVVVFPDGREVVKLPRNDTDKVAVGERAQLLATLLTAWTSDMKFAVDRLERLNAADSSGRFTGHLDLGRIGVMGHALGGATAVQFCHEDRRCKAALDIDGALQGSVVADGLRRPLMMLMSDQDHETNAMSQKILADIESVYDRYPESGRSWLVIRGANHFAFSDDGAVLKSAILRRVLRILGIVNIDGSRQIAATAHCVQAFFDAHIQDSDAALTVDNARFPEIETYR